MYDTRWLYLLLWKLQIRRARKSNMKQKLTEKIEKLESDLKEAVKSINVHEIELGIEKREKTRIQKELIACQKDLAKLEVIEQGSE